VAWRGEEDTTDREEVPPMSDALVQQRWDDEYRRGRYLQEPPLPFIETIVATLGEEPQLMNGPGLYVGCGSGRNYLPLVNSGANLYGIDISPEAIRQLTEQNPAVAYRLICGDFRSFGFGDGRKFHYCVAIQVFQHGREADAALYFRRVAELIHRGGLFFLRVNSAATEVYHRHTVIERNALGGFTVRYEEGPKAGLYVHFYSRDELLERTEGTFEMLQHPREVVIHRSPPQSGSWAQWEAIWRRSARD
jgi:2-polyprenyl-3-methyl-5-hydroxy-6-metoxy-1,4-benzoquinol methylase